MVHLFSSLLVLGLLPTSFAALKKFTLTVTNARIQPDGFSRSAIVVNGTFPAPVIAVNKGDSVEINLRNRMTDPTMRRSTSIHWHGFFQARTSGMDGPAMVNQCPIAPGDDFLYQFDTAGQTGNYWYHSHLSTQYCDGLRGTFVVYDPDDPLKSLYDVDDATTIITLGEWYHNPAPADQNTFFKTGIIPVQFAGLINGVGRFVGGPLVPYSVITVDKGKRYRFRIFSISCRPFFTFSVDNHTFDVMEFDGIEHDPVPVQNAEVYAAQRISIILHANQTVNNYWIRAPPTGGSPANNPAYDPTLTRAILRYRGAPAVEPTTTDPGGVKLNDGDMHPIAQEGPGKTGSQPPDIAINLDIQQPNAPFFDINGVSYIPPPLPILLQMLSGAVAPTDYLPSENVFVLGKNKTVEISIPGAGAHPFHLHGHAFDVIRQPNTDVVNYVNPPRRDVTPINGGNTTFRFVTDNSGAWFLHCHIDWHLEAGLAVAFSERPDEANTGPQAQIVTAGWRQLCPTYDGLAPEFQ